MEEGLRESGINIVGKVPWGTHFCQFYHTGKDLIDTLVPYFKSGLENNEFCMWVTSEPLTVAGARRAISEAIPDFDTYIKKGQCEILSYTDWYMKDGYFDMDRVVEGWLSKLNTALKAGYTGLRVTGNTAWLEKKDWSSFAEYEASLNKLGPHNIMALCTYNLDKCNALEIMEVMANHEFALIKREGNWSIIQNTIGLRENRELTSKIQEQSTILENVNDAVIEYDAGYRIIYWNRAAEKIYGYTATEAIGKVSNELLKPEYAGNTRADLVQKLLEKGHAELESRRTTKNGNSVYIESHIMVRKDITGKIIGFVAVDRDITDRNNSERALIASNGKSALLSETAALLLQSETPEQIVTAICNKVMAFLKCDTFFNFLVDEKAGKLKLNAYAGIPADIADTINWLDYGVAVCGCVARDRQRIIAEDILHRTDKMTGLIRSFGIQAYCCHPLIVQGHLLGTLSFGTRSRPSFTGDEVELMRTVVNQVAITMERKKVQDSWQTSERKYRSLFDNMSEGFSLHEIICDDNNRPIDYRFLEMNSAFERLTGLKRENVINRTMREVLPGEDKYWIEIYGKVALTGQSVHIEKHAAILQKTYEVFAYQPAPYQFATIFIDISERKHIEEDLRETSDYLNNLFNYANAPIIVWGPDFKITRFNHAFERLTGLKAEEAIGRPIEILFPTDQKQVSMGYIRRATAGNELWETVEIPISGNDGTVRTVLWNSANLHSPDGKSVIATIAQGHDITERKVIESELVRVNRELHAINDCHQSIMHALNEQTLLNDICRIVCDIGGYRMAWVGSVENDIRKSVRPMAWGGVEDGYLASAEITWADTERGRGPTGVAARTGKTDYFQDFARDPRATIWREPGLKRGYHSSIAIPLKDIEGHVFAVFTLYSAIANGFTPVEIELLERLAGEISYGIRAIRTGLERDLAEKALRESENELATILSSVPILTLVVDEDLRIIKANKTAQIFAGRSEKEIEGSRTGEAIRCLNSLDDPRGCGYSEACRTCKTRETILDTFKTGRSHSQVEWHLPFMIDGKHEDITFLLSSVIMPTEAKQALVCIEDITERKHAEEATIKLNRLLSQRADELEAANKELEAFSYSVSHDLRAPLRSIEGFSDALLTDYMDRLDGQGKQYLSWIQESSVLMAQLIDDLLKLSRVTRGEMHFEDVNLSEIVQTVAAELKKTDPVRKVDLFVALDMKANCDYNLLKVVLDNLLGNAWKFTSRKTGAKIEVGITEKDSKTVYFVRDNGAGFDMNYAGKLFLPFQRLHKTEDFPGTGIGLATVQRIINRHGGKVWAEGKVNEGAVFYFTLGK